MTSKDPGAVHFTWVVLTAGVTIYFVFTLVGVGGEEA